jgi:hypothetical protein
MKVGNVCFMGRIALDIDCFHFTLRFFCCCLPLLLCISQQELQLLMFVVVIVVVVSKQHTTVLVLVCVRVYEDEDRHRVTIPFCRTQKNICRDDPDVCFS